MRAVMGPHMNNHVGDELDEHIRMGGTPPVRGARPQLRSTATVLRTLHCHVTTSNHPLIESPSPSDY